MWRYFGIRLLLFIPTLVLVSVLAFVLQEAAPGDPVQRYLREDPMAASSHPAEQRMRERAFQRAVQETGADLPAFYLTLRPASLPDTLHRILPFGLQKTYRAWCMHTGDPQPVHVWYTLLAEWRDSLASASALDGVDLVRWRQSAALLAMSADPAYIHHQLSQWPAGLLPDLRARMVAAVPSVPDKVRWRNGIPRLRWHGADNRYHRWMTRFFTRDSQRSMVDGQPVWTRIGQAARWTLIINGIAILLAYGISIPLGVWMASRAGTPSESRVTLLTYALYAVPGFWLGTMLLVFLTSPTYGLDLFPAMGPATLPADIGWWETLQLRTSHLFLPVFCLTYGSVAYLARHVRNAMLGELKMEYVRAALARGLSRRQVLWSHAFPNALFPLITLLAWVLPAALAGSVAIEVIFNIPGMGRLSYQAILQEDWPIVYGILLLASVLTLTGSLIADLLYQLADPRVRLRKA
jgi:peptide/nickel transport system permease protein